MKSIYLLIGTPRIVFYIPGMVCMLGGIAMTVYLLQPYHYGSYTPLPTNGCECVSK